MHRKIAASLALACLAPMATPADADTGAEINQLKRELQTLRSSYEARLQQLEQRLQAAEAAAAGARPTAVAPMPSAAVAPAAPAKAPVTATAATAATAASSATPATGANAFNPAISLVLSGLYARTSRDPEGYTIRGVPLAEGAEVGPGGRGFSLGESELAFSANIDPQWRGVARFALHGDGVSAEEVYVQTTALGAGLGLKAGRFFSGIGYLNEQHAHNWDFVDNPLAYQALLGTQYGDDGVQLRWLAPTDRFVQLGLELGRGRGFPGGDNSRNGTGMVALTAHSGGDWGASHSWRAGLSVLNAKADDQGLSALDSAGDPLAARFTGSTRVWVADAVWKWAPNGNATSTSFKLQGEWLRSRRDGTLAFDPGATDRYRATTSGWYVQGVYQFMPAWRVGLRTEALSGGRPEYGANAGLWADGGSRPRKNSLMVDYSASEFSRLRLQLAEDRSRPGAADRQVFLQYQMSLGAHGAHSY